MYTCVCVALLFQVERCITLLRTNSEAARRFYQLAVGHLSVAEVAKFILSIQLAIVHCIEEEGGVTEERTDQENDPGVNNKVHGPCCEILCLIFVFLFAQRCSSLSLMITPLVYRKEDGRKQSQTGRVNLVKTLKMNQVCIHIIISV